MDLWGKCTDLSYANAASCSYPPATLLAESPCPLNYYCGLIWKDTNCTGVEATDTTIYGRCVSVDSSINTTCPW